MTWKIEVDVPAVGADVLEVIRLMTLMARAVRWRPRDGRMVFYTRGIADVAGGAAIRVICLLVEDAGRAAGRREVRRPPASATSRSPAGRPGLWDVRRWWRWLLWLLVVWVVLLLVESCLGGRRSGPGVSWLAGLF